VKQNYENLRQRDPLPDHERHALELLARGRHQEDLTQQELERLRNDLHNEWRPDGAHPALGVDGTEGWGIEIHFGWKDWLFVGLFAATVIAVPILVVWGLIRWH
jgi:hypothetical protein